MIESSKKITIIGAGINGLVTANYLALAGHQVTMLERSDRVGGACVSETAEVHGIRQDYVWREAGLADRLHIWAPQHPNLVHFPGADHPVWIYRDASQQYREFADKWGEQGDLAAFRADEDRVVQFLQEGYRAGRPPSVEEAVTALRQS